MDSQAYIKLYPIKNFVLIIVSTLLLFFISITFFLHKNGKNNFVPKKYVNEIPVKILDNNTCLIKEKECKIDDLLVDLEPFMEKSSIADNVIILHVEKDVPVEKLINIATIAKKFSARIAIATK